jgi:hypothetical protein
MARTITARALECINTGPTVATKITITKPGGEPITLNVAPGWEVTEAGPVAGTRLTISSITFEPTDGVDDLFGLVGWPGAQFDAYIGINLGTTVEYIPVFNGYVVDGSSRRDSQGVTASLADPWSYFDRIPFTDPLETTTDTRAQLIGDLFTTLQLGVSVIVTGDGGTVSQAGVYTNTRGQAAGQLATDGLLQAGFDGSGDLVIKDQPAINGTLTPTWRLKSGDASEATDFGILANDYPTIVAGTLERTRPWADSLINAVAVTPAGEWQAWSAQKAYLTDTTDPRHEDYVGLRGVEIASNTIDNTCDALTLAKNELARRLRGSAERMRVTCAINPAIEADDIIWVAALPTVDDPGWAGTYIITGVTHSPSAGTTALEAVSAAAYELGQVA